LADDEAEMDEAQHGNHVKALSLPQRGILPKVGMAGVEMKITTTSPER
jgi:hypothetical protein